MREFSTPPTFQVPLTGSLTDDIIANAAGSPSAVLFSRPDGPRWRDVTASEFLEQVRAVAKGLLACGIETGDRVGLLSKTRYEWTLLDYAIWYAGAVTVPIYETSSAEQVEWILADSGARAVMVETAAHFSRVDSVRSALPQLAQVWCLDQHGVGHLEVTGRSVADDDLEGRRTAVTPSALATLVYTSGTTGRPKGCALTHGNFMFELGVTVDELHLLFEPDEASTLLFLPLAHVFARVIAIGSVRGRVRLGHSGDVRHLLDDLASFRPTFLLAVPRVFEKILNATSQNATADGRGALFDRAADTAVAYSTALEHGRPGLLLRARHKAFDRLVYGRLREALGGKCRFAVSGGAPLGARLGHFYRGIGLEVLEGYGLTETTAAVTVNRPGEVKMGTVGRPLPGTSVRVADDGELLVRGGQVMQGYWRNDEATRQVLTPDGWLHTGDLGEIDDEGFVRVAGRLKEVIVTAGGKNVSPTVLEDRIRAHPLVSHCMVVGDGQPFIAALVTIDPDAFTHWAGKTGETRDIAELTDDENLLAEIAAAIDAANLAVSQAEAVRKFVILPVDWTEEGGQLTASLKVKRNVVLRQFRREVEGIFSR